MYEQCWKRLTKEVENCVDKRSKSIDPKVLLAYMDSLEELEKIKAECWKLEQLLKDKVNEP